MREKEKVKVPWWIQSIKPWKRNYINSGKYRFYARRKARRWYNNINKAEKINNTSYKKYTTCGGQFFNLNNSLKWLKQV